MRANWRKTGSSPRSTAREIGELIRRGTTNVPTTLDKVLKTTNSPTTKPIHAAPIRLLKRTEPRRRHYLTLPAATRPDLGAAQ